METLYCGKHLKLIRKNEWEYVERLQISGIVVIIAVTNDNKLILTEQFRPPVDKSVIELPAGLAGDVFGHEQEDLESAARRELLEETGYTCDTMELLTEGPPSAGLSSEIVTLFKASGLKKVHSGGGDGSENILIHEIPLSDIVPWIQHKLSEGLAIDPKIFTGIYFASSQEPPR